jgi:hypothetical protein
MGVRLQGSTPRAFVDGGERRLRKVQTGRYRLDRVFYKELEKGAYKIVDGNMMLPA